MNIGLDIGYSAVKAISGPRRVNFPSVVGDVQKARFSLDGARDSDIILTEPKPVLIGAGAIEQSRFPRRREDRAWWWVDAIVNSLPAHRGWQLELL